MTMRKIACSRKRRFCAAQILWFATSAKSHPSESRCLMKATSLRPASATPNAKMLSTHFPRTSATSKCSKKPAIAVLSKALIQPSNSKLPFSARATPKSKSFAGSQTISFASSTNAMPTWRGSSSSLRRSRCRLGRALSQTSLLRKSSNGRRRCGRSTLISSVVGGEVEGEVLNTIGKETLRARKRARAEVAALQGAQLVHTGKARKGGKGRERTLRAGRAPGKGVLESTQTLRKAGLKTTINIRKPKLRG